MALTVPFNWALVRATSVAELELTVGAAPVEAVATSNTPSVRVKYVSFLFVAGELVEPQVPAT